MTPALSCYTTALHDYSAALGEPLAVDRGVALCAGEGPDDLAFSHHAWWGDHAGGRLDYRAADDPAAAATAIAAEVRRRGSAIVVVNTATVPWSLATQALPHWLLVRAVEPGGPGTDDLVEVVDSFAALLPSGEQRAHRETLPLSVLADLMRLPDDLPPWVRRRDRHALGGGPVDVPPGAWRWLCLVDLDEPVGGPPTRSAGWTRSTGETLALLAEVLPDAPDLMDHHVDDLWAASRHRLAGLDADAAPALVQAWEALPRSLRFCVDSAARGRPRAAMARTSLLHLAELEHRHPDPSTPRETP